MAGNKKLSEKESNEQSGDFISYKEKGLKFSEKKYNRRGAV